MDDSEAAGPPSPTQVLLNSKELESLRVVDLREELERRGLPKSGTKKELVLRLRAALLSAVAEVKEADDEGHPPSEETTEVSIKAEAETKETSTNEEPMETSVKEEEIHPTTVEAVTKDLPVTPHSETVAPAPEVDLPEPASKAHPDSMETTESGEQLVTIRRMGNNTAVRHKRQWRSSTASRSGSGEVVENISGETISSETLKDLIPDIKPLLSEELEEEEEEEDKLDIHDFKDPLLNVQDEGTKDDLAKSYAPDTTNDISKPAVDDAKEIKEEKLPIDEEEEDDGAATVVHVSNLVRPFTVNQLRELLSRTGQIAEDGFAINKIKSECAVKFRSSRQARDTVAALNGVKWPPSNPKMLSVASSTEEVLLSMQTSVGKPQKEEGLSGAKRARLSPSSKENGSVVDKNKDHPQPLEALFLKTKATPNLYWKMAISK